MIFLIFINGVNFCTGGAEYVYNSMKKENVELYMEDGLDFSRPPKFLGG